MARTASRLHGGVFDAVLAGPPDAGFTPANCPHCEYDRRFPGFESGGWMQQDNNGPIVSCPYCNDDGSHPRDPSGQ